MGSKALVTSQHPQTRREFCISACQVGSLLALSTSLGTLLTGCEDPASSGGGGGGGGNLQTIQATVSNGTITITINQDSPLASVGSAAMVQYNGGSLLVAHTGDTSFTALTTICTHQQCTITGFQNQLYTCPCHGSQFQTNGQVARGPAASPLHSFQTQFAKNQLTITL